MVDRADVVIVGAGFAGLNAARAFEGSGLTVRVVDRHNYHTFQPLLYQVATAGLNAADVAYPIRAVFRRAPNVSFLNGTVAGVDPDADEVVLSDGRRLGFSYLVVATGSRTNYFDVAGAEPHAYPLYELGDATRLRNHVLRCFEDADAQGDPGGALTFVVVGAGPTGVEMAGALVELFRTVLNKDFPTLDVSRARVVLIEMLDSVLPPFSAPSQRFAHRALAERGVEVRLGEQVEAITPDDVRLVSGEVIAARTVIWAAGVKGSTLGRSLGAKLDKAGRVAVERDLSLPGRRNVFVVGDLALARDPSGDPYPQLAPVAIQAGEHAARQVLRRVRGERTEPFVYTDKGIMATIGRRAAVAELASGIRLSGTIAWLAWLLLHLLFLVGFRNRASVLLNWAWNYLTWDRGPRLIFEPRRAGGGEAEEAADA